MSVAAAAGSPTRQRPVRQPRVSRPNADFATHEIMQKASRRVRVDAAAACFVLPSDHGRKKYEKEMILARVESSTHVRALRRNDALGAGVRIATAFDDPALSFVHSMDAMYHRIASAPPTAKPPSPGLSNESR